MANKPNKNPAAVLLGRRGGKARAANLTPAERSASARMAVAAMWANLTPEQRSERAKSAAKKRKKGKS